MTLNLAILVPWIAVVICPVIILKELYCDSPYSLFFRNSSKTDLLNRVYAENQVRMKKSRVHFEDHSSMYFSSFYSNVLNGGDIDIAVAIITVRRPKSVGYLLQTAAALDDVIRTDHNFRSYMFICNVDDDPLAHHDAQFLSAYLPYVDYRDTSSTIWKHANQKYQVPRRPQQMNNILNKEFHDYITCLNLARNATGARFVLAIQDDSVPYVDSFDVLKHMLYQRLPRYHNDTLQKFAYLKLYFPEKWQGYGYDAEQLLDLLSFGAVTGSLVCFFMIRYCYSRRSRRVYPSVTFAASVLYCIILARLVGRQNINDLRRVSCHFYRLQRSPSCCIPAMLYQSDMIPGITEYLATKLSKKERIIDLLLHNYTVAQNVTAYLVVPSLFRHIGMYTTLHTEPERPEYFLT